MTSIFNNSTNADDLCVEGCILKLVKTSLKRKATKIAVRFDPKKHNIQVVDNGIGFDEQELFDIFKAEPQPSERKHLFCQTRSLSDVVIVTSRSAYSPHTYVHIVSASGDRRFFKGYDRPSTGTTVSAYDFKSSSWSINDECKNASISYVIAAVALMELKVSFSLRNDDQDRVLLFIASPHSTWEVFQYMTGSHSTDRQTIGCTAECEASSSLRVFTEEENRVNSGKLEKLESSQKSCFVFASLLDRSTDEEGIGDYNDAKNQESSQNNFLFGSLLDKSTNDDESAVDDSNDTVCSPISEWSNWSYKPPHNVGTRETNNNANDGGLFCSAIRNNGATTTTAVENDFINLSQLSVWSDWSSKPCSRNLQGNKTAIPSSERVLDGPTANGGCSQYSMETIRYWLSKIKFRSKFQVSKDTIDSLEILRQINNEFIVAITSESGKKLLILIDQHAVHERIRYEWLIDSYRDKKSCRFFAKKLRGDLLISDMNSESLQILAQHRKLLINVGIHLTSIVNSTSCTVDRVPKCFLKKVKSYNHELNFDRLIKNVRQLLLEIANGIAESKCTILPMLPIAINNIIASEACHGAIKFGDPLNVEECTTLIKALQDTKAPTRCAHGRPSIVPLIDLTDLGKLKPPVKTRLNFGALKNRTLMKK